MEGETNKQSKPSSKTANIALVYRHNILTLPAEIPENIHHNDSFIYTLAQYLAELNLPPKTVDQETVEWVKSDQSQDFMQVWCDYLCGLVYSDQIYRKENTVLMMDTIEKQYYEYLLASKAFRRIELAEEVTSSNLKKAVARQMLGVEDLVVKANRVIIINFSGSVGREDKISPKINIEALYTGIFYQNQDIWSSYKILCGQIATVEQLTEGDVLMLSGSSQSVYNNNPYVEQIAENMRQALSLNTQLKVMAICFGHQLIAKIYHSHIQRRQFVQGPQPIKFFPSKFGTKVPYLSQMYREEKRVFKLSQVHGDFVVSVPKGFVKIGSSNTCEIESMISEDMRIFTVQFHPEYSSEYWRMMRRRWNNIKYKEYASLNEGFMEEDHHRSVKIMRVIVRDFLDWKCEKQVL